ncbi:DUF3306 domain-containing protein [Shimia sagamensis]|uniref:DUF3306 domain-containing protein n=1 Tax=Shimia sagamensis TaxID=1566352 RepID=A0ABY1N9H0_9RHOB|nr:DUF3306 domain-containing protein [Shimia sagamensis]SMP03907.1 Protein of unknown function [Shimia sagamensis]
MSRGGDFWARRKAGVAAEAEAEVVAVEKAELAQTHAELEEKSDAEILAELDLPDPDGLEKGDDFSVFLEKAVPERIRRRALRKLWLSNPVLANIDELVDYGEDFTDSAMAVEAIQTTYQVGKGMLAHVKEMARQEEEAKALAEGRVSPEDFEAQAETTLVESSDESDVVEVEEVAPIDVVAEAEAPTEPFPDAEALPVAPLRRRMRFDFAASETTEERA